MPKAVVSVQVTKDDGILLLEKGQMVGTYQAVQLLAGGMYRLVMRTVSILMVRDLRWGSAGGSGAC